MRWIACTRACRYMPMFRVQRHVLLGLLAELLQSKQAGNEENETANSLHALVAGNGKKKTKVHDIEE
eukprot:631756-Pelagomonas_calceolata.AAC.2